MGVDLHWFFARKITARAEGAVAHVHERPVPDLFSLGAPFVRLYVESKCAFDGLDLAQPALANQLDSPLIYGFKMPAVTDHQLLFCALAGGDHLARFRNRG